MIPFTIKQFLEIFALYNQAIFPMQVVLVLLAFAATFLAVKPNKRSSKVIALILGFLWLWMGVVYHLLFFTQINEAAYIFGGVFILQGFVFLINGVALENFSFRARWDFGGIAGASLIAYALLIYPVLGFVFGHSYPHSPTFGAPCPTTIFTFGLLLWTDRNVPVHLLIIPVLWSLIGFFAAVSFGIYEDIGLLLAGVSATVIFILRNRSERKN